MSDHILPRTSSTSGRAGWVSDATRHLCAAVYLDRKFSDLVIRKVHNDPRHRVAPSSGFDLIPVVWHAWRSRALDDAQRAVLMTVLIVGYLTDRPAVIAAVCAIGLWYLVPHVLRAAPEVVRLRAKTSADQWLGRRVAAVDHSKLREQTRLLAVSGAACVILADLPVLTAKWGKISPLEVFRRAALLVLLMAVLAVLAGAIRQRELNKLHAAAGLRPARLSKRLRSIDEQQSHTCVVYQRRVPRPEDDEPTWWRDPFGEPGFFVGSGQLVHRWLPPLVVRLVRPGEGSMAEREYATAPFTADALVEHLRKALNRVSGAPRPLGLPSLEVSDRVYVADDDLAINREYLRGRYGQERLSSIINNPHGIADHFIEVRVTTSGELVTSVFLRVTVKGHSLSLDFAACALTRTPMDYHLMDGFGESGKSAILFASLRSLRDLPSEIGGLWRLMQLPVLLAGGIRSGKDSTLIPRRRRTIGTRLSVREQKSTPWLDSDFDEPEIQDAIKIIELCLIRATEDFLDSKNVDTAAFKQRAGIIISASVLNMGGRMDIINSAVGPQARINYAAAANSPASETPPEGASS